MHNVWQHLCFTKPLPINYGLIFLLNQRKALINMETFPNAEPVFIFVC